MIDFGKRAADDLTPPQVTFVIRSVGERTEGRCRDAILAQGVPAENVVIIREIPFSRAMRVGYQVGIEAGRPWTYCIDADVIMRPGAIDTVLAFAARQKANVFEVQAFVLDKLMVSLRMAGNHLFRTAHLERMIASIPQQDVVRPETDAMRAMMGRGLEWRAVPHVIGLHDFGQANRDIFRKCFTHSHKHLHLLPQIVAGMRSRSASDPDCQIALQGIAEGLRAESDVRIDVRHKPFNERFEALAIPEKPSLQDDELALGSVDETLKSWSQSDDLSVRGLPVSAGDAIALDGRSNFNRLDRLRAVFARKRTELDPVQLVPLVLGTGLVLLGQRLKAGQTAERLGQSGARITKTRP